MKFEIVKLKVGQEYWLKRKGEPYRDRNKLYIWPEGESVMENLFNRHNRPSKFYKEVILPAVIEKLKETNSEAYEYLKTQKWGWRQKCGCNCPCSPGFVSVGYGFYDISVTIKFEN